jgi:hypothetical protein
MEKVSENTVTTTESLMSLSDTPLFFIAEPCSRNPNLLSGEKVADVGGRMRS